MIRISRLLFSIILLMSFLRNGLATAPCPVAPSLESFLCKTNEEYRHLQLIGEVEILTGTVVLDHEEIAEEVRKRIKPFIAKAKNTVFFNTRAGEALNDFYAYWLTLIDNFKPLSYENLFIYQQRNADRDLTLQEKAHRLRITLE